MTQSIRLRPAETKDYDMALELYLVTMEPYTAELMSWNEEKQRAFFAAQWSEENSQIINMQGRDVGWIQVLESEHERVIQQFFVAPEFQNQGIGSHVLQMLLHHWQATDRPVVLAVLKNNPARTLYERFGFNVVAEQGIKLRMERAV